MSETCPILTIARVPGDARPRIWTAGRPAHPHRLPVPLVDLRIVDGRLLDARATASAPARSWCARRG
jgi:hypothetical protein